MKQRRVELVLIACGIAVLAWFYLSERSALEEKGLTHLVGITGVPLDDVYIHCRYAENLLAGNGYCFNPGATVTADTSPLWVLLVALGGLFASHLEVVAVLLSAIFYLIFIVAAYRFALSIGIEKNWAVVTGVLVLFSARIVWSALSGMEVMLASLLALWALDAHFKKRYHAEAIFLALGIAARPELMLLAAILFCDQLLLTVKKKEAAGQLIASALIFTLVVAPVFLLPLLERGSLLYHSSVVQGAGGGADIGYLLFVAAILFGTVTPPFFVALYSVYLIRDDRRYRLMQIFAFGLPIALAIFAPQYRHHGRYFFPIIAVMIVLGVAVFDRVLRHRKPLWTLIILFLLMLHAALGMMKWNGVYKYAVTNIAGQQVATADWVMHNTVPTDVIAAHDVGALGYFTKRPVIDLVGLVTPEVYPLMHDQKLVWQYARAHGANVFIIYNRLNPSLYAYAKDSFELEASLRVEPLVSSADTVMSIYRVKHDGTH